jgi:hypothetical protein
MERKGAYYLWIFAWHIATGDSVRVNLLKEAEGCNTIFLLSVGQYVIDFQNLQVEG